MVRLDASLTSVFTVFYSLVASLLPLDHLSSSTSQWDTLPVFISHSAVDLKHVSEGPGLRLLTNLNVSQMHLTEVLVRCRVGGDELVHWAAAFVSMWSGSPLCSDRPETHRAFKSCEEKNKAVLFSEAWEPSPPLRTLFPTTLAFWPTSLKAHYPTAFMLCVFIRSVKGHACAGVCVCCKIGPPFLRGGVYCWRAGVGWLVEERKHCEAFCFHSRWQEGKGWEHHQVLSPRSLFQRGRG